jgi:hypothetical protein
VFVTGKPFQPCITFVSEPSGLYYKNFMIVIYNRNDSGQYYKTMITIVIYDAS